MSEAAKSDKKPPSARFLQGIAAYAVALKVRTQLLDIAPRAPGCFIIALADPKLTQDGEPQSDRGASAPPKKISAHKLP